MIVAEHVTGDADMIWLYILLGIIGFIVIVLIAIFDNAGRPRRWLPKRWRRHSSER